MDAAPAVFAVSSTDHIELHHESPHFKFSFRFASCHRFPFFDLFADSTRTQSALSGRMDARRFRFRRTLWFRPDADGFWVSGCRVGSVLI